MTLWLTISAAGLLTFLTRLSFIAIHGRVELPAWFKESLAFVPVAVLSAIIFPDLMAPEGAVNITPGNVRLVAGLIAVLVAWRTKNVWMTIAVGMVALFVLVASGWFPSA